VALRTEQPQKAVSLAPQHSTLPRPGNACSPRPRRTPLRGEALSPNQLFGVGSATQKALSIDGTNTGTAGTTVGTV
jgi:hypothetical protein